MAKRRKKSKSSHPNPIYGFLNLCAGATTALITRNMILNDIEKGKGEESLKAAMIVYGSRSLFKGDAIGLGGMIGINSALKASDKQAKSYDSCYVSTPKVDQHQHETKSHKEAPKYVWRKFCEDGTMYGISLNDFETADEYEEALSQAKHYNVPEKDAEISPQNVRNSDVTTHKYVWRKYCKDGTSYGISPEDYETADDYEEAIQLIKSKKAVKL